MRLRFDKPTRENSDLEIIAVSVAVLALATGWVLLVSGIHLPACNFRRMTGYPCPGCGGTRAWLMLARLQLVAALQMNPLVAALGMAGGLFALYSAVALIFRLPRLRLTFSTRTERRVFWIAVACITAANWVYLILVHR